MHWNPVMNTSEDVTDSVAFPICAACRLVKLRDSTALKTHWGHDWAVANTNWDQSLEEEDEEAKEEDSPAPTQDLLSAQGYFGQSVNSSTCFR